MNKKELIWVDKEFAEKYKKFEGEENQRQIEIDALNEYMQSVKEDTRKNFKLDLEGIEEDAAVYRGSLLQVKQAFEKAKNEHYQTTYEMWENIDKEIPSITEKTQKVINILNPLSEKLNELNASIAKIEIWNIEKLVETMKMLSSLFGENEKMVKFLINNYKGEN